MAPFKVMYKGMQEMYIILTNSEGFLYLGRLYLLTTPQLRYNGNHKPILVHSDVHNSLPPGPDEFSPHALILSLYDPIKHHPPTYILVTQHISIFKIFQSFVHMLYLSHAFYMLNSCHPSQPDNLNTK